MPETINLSRQFLALLQHTLTDNTYFFFERWSRFSITEMIELYHRDSMHSYQYRLMQVLKLHHDIY